MGKGDLLAPDGDFWCYDSFGHAREYIAASAVLVKEVADIMSWTLIDGTLSWSEGQVGIACEEGKIVVQKWHDLEPGLCRFMVASAASLIILIRPDGSVNEGPFRA